jgi:hypothetical protein
VGKRSADDGNDSRAGSDGVTPGASHREREVADPRVALARMRGRLLSPGDAQMREVRGGIPPGELRVEGATVVDAHADTVLSAKGVHGR